MPPDTLSRAGFLVLLALAGRPRHGLAIIERVEEASGGTVKLGFGSLYGTLQKLLDAGLIREVSEAPDPDDDDARRRYYRIAPRGQRALKAEAARLRHLVSAAIDQGII